MDKLSVILAKLSSGLLLSQILAVCAFAGISDVQYHTVNSQGGVDVYCKDGTFQTVSQAQFDAGNVCEPPVSAVIMGGSTTAASTQAFIAGVKKHTGRDPLVIKDVAQDLSAALASTSIFILPYSSEYQFSDNNKAHLRNFVADGGVIVAVDWRTLPNLSGVFSWSLSPVSAAEGLYFDLQNLGSLPDPGIRSVLSGSPNRLKGIGDSDSCAIASLPNGGHSLYSNSGNSIAFTIRVGRGNVVWFGWDWRDAYPSGSAGQDYYNIFTKVMDYAARNRPVNRVRVDTIPQTPYIDNPGSGSGTGRLGPPEPSYDDEF